MNIKVKLTIFLILITILGIFIYLIFINEKPEESIDAKIKQAEVKFNITEDDIKEKIELIISENKEYIENLGDNKKAIETFIINKAKKDLPGVAASKIVEVIDSILEKKNSK